MEEVFYFYFFLIGSRPDTFRLNFFNPNPLPNFKALISSSPTAVNRKYRQDH